MGAGGVQKVVASCWVWGGGGGVRVSGGWFLHLHRVWGGGGGLRLHKVIASCWVVFWGGLRLHKVIASCWVFLLGWFAPAQGDS